MTRKAQEPTADYALVTDEHGAVCGIWLRDPDNALPERMGYIEALLVANGASELVVKRRRLVPNLYDQSGGCFVMFGDAKAPGEGDHLTSVAVPTGPPQPGAEWSIKGARLAEQGRWEEALACYDKAIELDSGDAVTWHNRGVALGQLGRWDEALSCYTTGLAIAPDLADLWQGKAAALWKLGRLEEAVLASGEAAQLNPDNAELRQMHDTLEAMANAQGFIAFSSDDEAAPLDPDAEGDTIMADDLVTPDNLSKDLLHAVFDAAFMDASWDVDGDLVVSDRINCTLILSENNDSIRLFAAFGFKETATHLQRLDCVNNINLAYATVRAAAHDSGQLHFDHYINVRGGVSKKNIVLTTKWFMSICLEAVPSHGGDLLM